MRQARAAKDNKRYIRLHQGESSKNQSKNALRVISRKHERKRQTEKKMF